MLSIDFISAERRNWRQTQNSRVGLPSASWDRRFLSCRLPDNTLTNDAAFDVVATRMLELIINIENCCHRTKLAAI